MTNTPPTLTSLQDELDDQTEMLAVIFVALDELVSHYRDCGRCKRLAHLLNIWSEAMQNGTIPLVDPHAFLREREN